MLNAGLDVGSLYTKAVVLDGQHVAGRSHILTGNSNSKAAESALREALSSLHASIGDLDQLVVTGAGRSGIEIAHEEATEVLCAARGAYFADPDARVVLDLGGESTRIVKLDDAGDVLDFAVNGRCAAGTGIFLDAMVKVMGISLEDAGPLSLKSTADINITSMCVVFAESEVVSQVHRQTPKEDIMAGIHRSIATRIFGLVNRLEPKGKKVAIGGLARNSGIIGALAQMLGETVVVPQDPQFVSALGAALIARRKAGEP